MIFDDDEISSRWTAKCEDLKETGLTCTNCTLLSRCIKDGNKWLSVDVEICNQNGYFCNILEGRCSNSTGACNQPGFKCTSEGNFPNPFNCREYYYCVGSGQIQVNKRDCEIGWAYNPTDQLCSLPLTSSVCTEAQFTCKRAGDIAAWPGTTNIYYICIFDSKFNKTLPELHKCSGSQVFEIDTCVNRSETTNTPTPTPLSTTDDSNSGTQPTSTEPGTPTEPNEIVCVVKGEFPHPTNCRSYYKCSASLILAIFTCSAGKYYSIPYMGCIVGNC